MKKHLSGRLAASTAIVFVFAAMISACSEARAQEQEVMRGFGIRLPGGVSLSGKLQTADTKDASSAAVLGVVGGADWTYTDGPISISTGISSTITFSKERGGVIAPYARFSSSIYVNEGVQISPYAHIRTRVPLLDEGHAGSETVLDIGARSSWDVTEEVALDQRINARRTWLPDGRKLDLSAYEAGVSWRPSGNVRVAFPRVSVEHRFGTEHTVSATTSSITTTLDVTF